MQPIVYVNPVEIIIGGSIVLIFLLAHIITQRSNRYTRKRDDDDLVGEESHVTY